MRTSVLLWLLGGTAVLASFTNEMVHVSARVTSGLEQLRRSGPIGLNAVAFMTLATGRVTLLVVVFLLL